MKNPDAALLHQLWVAGHTFEAMAKRFGVTVGTIYKWSKRYKLPKRAKPGTQPVADPTPDEIERMKAELKRRHMAERMAEAPCNTHSKVSKWPAGVCQPRGVA